MVVQYPQWASPPVGGHSLSSAIDGFWDGRQRGQQLREEHDAPELYGQMLESFYGPGASATPQQGMDLAALGNPATRPAMAPQQMGAPQQPMPSSFGPSNVGSSPPRPDGLQQPAMSLAALGQPQRQSQANPAVFGGALPNPSNPAEVPAHARGAAPRQRVANLQNGADPMAAYMASTMQAESGGNPNARNPNSTATGPYQFLEGTWSDLAGRYPDLALTPDGRTDPAQAERAMRAFTSDNARALSGAGLPVNPASLYASHFLGSGGAQPVLQASPETPMMALVGPEVIQANPHLAEMTQGDFMSWAGRNGGGQGGGYAAPKAGPNGMPQPMGRQVPLPPRETMQAMLSNSITRPLAISLMQQAQTAQAVDQFQVFRDNGGTTWQTNLATGETSVLQDPSDTQTRMPAAPSGYQFGQGGRSLEAIPGGPADPQNPMNSRRVGQAPMSATIQKEIFEADESVQAGTAVVQALDRAMELNESAWEGPFTEQRAYGASLFGNEGATNTLELKNLVTAQALDQLKATFGAMPTEGERKILLEIQGSVDQPREVRARIFQRARAAAERRIESNRAKAMGLRSGDYFDPSFGPGAQPDAGAQPMRIDSPQQFEALPSGTMFVAPDGSTRRKP